MQFTDPVKIAYRNLAANKFRSFLTILGIIIGVGSVILIMAIGQSAQGLILDQIKGVGSNLVVVLPGGSDQKGPPAEAMGIAITTLKYDDFLAVMEKNNVPEIQNGAAYVQANEIATYNGKDMSESINGVTHDYAAVENIDIQEGRSFLPEEDTNMARVAVIGANVQRDLFNGEDPIGKKFKMNDQLFTVVGVFKVKGGAGFGGGATDDIILLPFRTTQKTLLGIDHINLMRLKIGDASQIPAAEDDIAKTLRIRHNIQNPVDDDFSVRDIASALTAITNVTDILRYFLLAVASISLVVGGVGIMNIMLISVNQRIHEVGLRKAVGAKNSDILEQFLIESATITLAGGLAGIIWGVLFAFLISVIVTNGFGYDWQFLISWQSIAVATLVSVAIGLVFGIYPARKASKISPMEALRYE